MRPLLKSNVCDGLNDKQVFFCEQYLVDLNATQAAIRAGYSKRTARQQAARLMRKPAITDYLSEAAMAKCESAAVSAEWVVKNIKSTVARCLEAHPEIDQQGQHARVVDRDGNQCLAYSFDAINALRGLELLAQYLSLCHDSSSPAKLEMQVISADTDSAAAARKYREMMGVDHYM